jgi:hypothetical protein
VLVLAHLERLKTFTAFQQTAVTERETAVVVGQMAEADFTAVVAHLMK